MDEYNASIFYIIFALPPHFGSIYICFIFLSFFSSYVSAVLVLSVILDNVLPKPQCWTGIWRWWITTFFSSAVLYILTPASMVFCVSVIVTGNDTGSPSDVLGDSLSLYGTTTSSLNFSPRISLTNVLYLVIIEALIVCSNLHENMVLYATPSLNTGDTVTDCTFTMKGVL